MISHVEHHKTDESIPDRLDRKWRINWLHFTVLTLLHLITLYHIFYVRPTIPTGAKVFATFFGVITSWSVTCGAHRLWSHRTFKVKLPLEIFLAFVYTCTYQNSIFTWVRDHRMHHKYTDTEADPHNSKRGFFFAHVGWLMLHKTPEVEAKKRLIDMSDLKANPVVMFQHRHYYKLVVLLCFIFPMSIYMHFWKLTLFQAFVMNIYRYVIAVNLTWCINSVAHFFGSKPYDEKISAVDSPSMIVLALGEGYHNYHHTFPHDYKASEFGGGFSNFTRLSIEFFAKMGWAYDLQTVSENSAERVAIKQGDGSRPLKKIHNDVVEFFKDYVLFPVWLYFLFIK